jgi:hypothetical protein
MTGPSVPRNVPALLLMLREEKHNGTVVVAGSPGGTIHLRNGLIAAIETPGAPTTESALLRSGRLDDEDWAVARAAARVAGAEGADPLGPELVARGSLGAAELEVICTAAVFEGGFAMALSPPGSWEVKAPVATIVAEPGIEPHRLGAETNRRMALLNRLWGSPAELARTRLRSAGAVGRDAARLSARYQAILAAANGRRTPRDLAFALGRGLYGVMLDLVRMDALGLILWENRGGAGRPSTAPRGAEGTAAGSVAETGQVEAVPLPRRSPGDHLPVDSGSGIGGGNKG